jgi:hypothetical protein
MDPDDRLAFLIRLRSIRQELRAAQLICLRTRIESAKARRSQSGPEGTATNRASALDQRIGRDPGSQIPYDPEMRPSRRFIRLQPEFDALLHEFWELQSEWERLSTKVDGHPPRI